MPVMIVKNREPFSMMSAPWPWSELESFVRVCARVRVRVCPVTAEIKFPVSRFTLRVRACVCADKSLVIRRTTDRTPATVVGTVRGVRCFPGHPLHRGKKEVGERAGRDRCDSSRNSHFSAQPKDIKSAVKQSRGSGERKRHKTALPLETSSGGHTVWAQTRHGRVGKNKNPRETVFTEYSLRSQTFT